MPSPSGSSSSTARSAPTSRISTSAPTTSAGRASRAATRCSCLTRPDVIAGMHDAFFDVGVDVVETATLRPLLRRRSPSTASPTRPHELNVAAARIAREVADGYAADGRRAASPARSGPARSSPTPRPHPLRRPARRLRGAGAAACSRAASTCSSSRRSIDLLQAKAAMIGCRRAMAAAGPRGAAPGAGHDGDHRPHARRHRDRRRPRRRSTRCGPTCIGINCATGPAEMQRAPALPAASTRRCRSRAAQRRPAVASSTASTHYDLTPEQLAEYHARFVTELGVARRRRLLRHHARAPRARWSRRCRDLDAGAARRRARAERRVDLHRRCRSTRTPSFLIIGERTNANGSKAFRDAMLAGDWDTCVADGQRAGQGGRPRARRVRRLRRPRRHRRHGRDRQRASPPRPACRSCSTPPSRRCIEAGAAADRRPGHPQLGQPRGRRAARARRLDRVFSLAREYGAAVICLLIDERGPGPRRRVEDARSPTASTTSPSSATACRAGDLIFDALDVPAVHRRRRPAPRRHGHDRGDPAHQGRDPRRVHRCSACPTSASASTPPARHVAQQRVPARVRARPASTRPSSTPARSCRCNRIPDEQREVCLDLDLRPAHADGYDPLQQLLEVFADVKSAQGREGGPHRLAGRGAPAAPHHRRRPRRPRPPTSTRRWPPGIAAARHRQRRAARRA